VTAYFYDVTAMHMFYGSCAPMQESPHHTKILIYEGESNESLKSAIKIRITAPLSVSFNNDTHGLKSGRQVAVRYYIEK